MREPAPPPSLWDVGEDRAHKQYRAPAEQQPQGLLLSGAGRPHPSQTNTGVKKRREAMEGGTSIHLTWLKPPREPQERGERDPPTRGGPTPATKT